MERVLKDVDIRAINSVLAKDQRVEVIPTKDGIKIFSLKRKEVIPDKTAEKE